MDINQIITDKIINLLECGTVKADESYHGINVTGVTARTGVQANEHEDVAVTHAALCGVAGVTEPRF